MEIAKNQKGIKSLFIDDELWKKINGEQEKIIITYGSNGIGKSTIKDLIINEKLNPNFDCENEGQENELIKNFKECNYLIFDENFVSRFVYSDKGLQKNELKIIMNNNEIQNLLNKRDKKNKIIANILEITTKYLNELDNIINCFNTKTPSGGVSKPKQKFSKTFINGKIVNSYESIFNIKDSLHKEWWYQGLNIYKNEELNFCPWCTTKVENISDQIQENIESVSKVTDFDSKIFSEKQKKIDELNILYKDSMISDEYKLKFTAIIDNLRMSLDQNLQEIIIEDFNKIYDDLNSQKDIFLDIKDNVKYINNILDIEHIKLTNNLNNVSIFSENEELKKLSSNINTIIKYCDELQNETNDANKELTKLVEKDELKINEIIKVLGLKYKVSINYRPIIEGGIDNNSEYVTLESLNGKDISSDINTTLSYGEKSTLSFAFFIQSVMVNSNVNTLIIIDDPISSYDNFRRFTSLGLIKMFKDIEYKKLFLFTHSSEFVISLINNFKGIKMNTLLLNEVDNGSINIETIENGYFNESKIYREVLLYNDSISMKVLALRLLHDIRKVLINDDKNMLIYDYLSKLIHYRKDDECMWKNSYIADIKELYNYFGIEYDLNIEKISDSDVVFKDIDNLLEQIKEKNIYKLEIMDIYSLRMIAEASVRNESNSPKRFSERKMWDINDSEIKKNLEPFSILLNSITHIDSDVELYPTINSNDVKSIPKYIISQIIAFLK